MSINVWRDAGDGCHRRALEFCPTLFIIRATEKIDIFALNNDTMLTVAERYTTPLSVNISALINE